MIHTENIKLKDIKSKQSSQEDIFINIVTNNKSISQLNKVKAIYLYEMSRTYRTISQSLIAPVISTTFCSFGSAIGSKIENIEGISACFLLYLV